MTPAPRSIAPVSMSSLLEPSRSRPTMMGGHMVLHLEGRGCGNQVSRSPSKFGPVITRLLPCPSENGRSLHMAAHELAGVSVADGQDRAVGMGSTPVPVYYDFLMNGC